MSESEIPDFLRVPDFLKSHPELIKRGLVLEYALNIGTVFTTNPLKQPYFVVKILNPANEEQAIIEYLQHDTTPRNYLIPCEIVRSDPALLIMPGAYGVDWPMLQETNRLIMLRICLRLCHQIAEGIDHLHRLRVAHLDVCFDNMMIADPRTTEELPQRDAGRVYIIDFDRSRRLELGPGRQPAIELPSTQYKPPLQMKRFDPYSWDVYCMGKVFERLIGTVFFGSSTPWAIAKLCQWVVGNERGCSGICRCRPTSRRVLLVLTILERTVGFLGVLWTPICAVRTVFASFRPRARVRD